MNLILSLLLSAIAKFADYFEPASSCSDKVLLWNNSMVFGFASSLPRGGPCTFFRSVQPFYSDELPTYRGGRVFGKRQSRGNKTSSLVMGVGRINASVLWKYKPMPAPFICEGKGGV